MNKTHGNCGRWTDETSHHVFCKPDLLPACWYSKQGEACPYWIPKRLELHLKLLSLVAEFYEGEKTPISIVAKCSDGNRYAVQPSHLMQVRVAQWHCAYYHYTENDIGYCRQTWSGEPINIVVVDDSRIGV